MYNLTDDVIEDVHNITKKDIQSLEKKMLLEMQKEAMTLKKNKERKDD